MFFDIFHLHGPHNTIIAYGMNEDHLSFPQYLAVGFDSFLVHRDLAIGVIWVDNLLTFVAYRHLHALPVVFDFLGHDDAAMDVRTNTVMN